MGFARLKFGGEIVLAPRLTSAAHSSLSIPNLPASTSRSSPPRSLPAPPGSLARGNEGASTSGRSQPPKRSATGLSPQQQQQQQQPPRPSSLCYQGPQDPPQYLTTYLGHIKRNLPAHEATTLAVQLIEERRRAGAALHPINFSAAIDVCLRHGDRSKARHLFRLMTEAGFHWAPAYCSMLQRGCAGPAEGFRLLEGLEGRPTFSPPSPSGVVADLKVLMALMDLCAQHGDVEAVERLQGRIAGGDYVLPEPSEARASSSSSDSEDEGAASPSPSPSPRSSSALASRDAQGSKGRRTVRRRNAFESRDQQVEMNLLLKACVRSPEPWRVFQVWHELVKVRGFVPCTVSYNILAEGYGRSGPSGGSLALQMLDCGRLLDDMTERAGRQVDVAQLPDAVTYTSLLKAVTRAGEAALHSPESEDSLEGLDLANDLLDRIVRDVTEGARLPGMERPAPPCLDLPLRSALIESLSGLGRAEEALALLNDWVAEGEAPRKYAYLALAKAFLAQGKPYLVEHVLERAGQEAKGRKGSVFAEFQAILAATASPSAPAQLT